MRNFSVILFPVSFCSWFLPCALLLAVADLCSFHIAFLVKSCIFAIFVLVLLLGSF